MDHLSFTHVPPEGLASFNTDLGADAWGAIDATPWEGTGQTAAKALGDAPAVIVHKVRLTFGLAKLVRAIEGAGSAKDCDNKWDSCQKQLKALLRAATQSTDALKREAAGRLQKSLLLGAGEAQTKLKYQQEVDFGRKQALIIADGQGKDDITLLGLGAAMLEVSQATDALATAIGHGQSAVTPYARLVAVTAECAASFVAVAEQLAWEIEHGQPGGDRDRAMAMRGPMEKLVARYPAPMATAPAAAAPAAPAAAGASAGTGGAAAPGGGASAPGGAAPTPGGGAPGGV
jgi:hypothetical protein